MIYLLSLIVYFSFLNKTQKRMVYYSYSIKSFWTLQLKYLKELPLQIYFQDHQWHQSSSKIFYSKIFCKLIIQSPCIIQDQYHLKIKRSLYLYKLFMSSNKLHIL